MAIAVALFVATLAFCWPTLQPHAPTLRNDIERGMVYSCDEYTVLYEADQMSRGFVPYRDFFDFKGPIGFLPFALAYKLGAPGVVTGRIAQFCVMAILAMLLYATARRLGASRLLGAGLGLLVPLFIWPCWSYAYQDFLGQVFLLAAALCALGDRWLWSGAMVALAAWTTLAQGVTAAVTLPLCGAILALEDKRDWRPLVLRFTAGFFALSTAILLALLATGALPQALRDIFVFPFRVYPTANRTVYAFDVPSRLSRWNHAPLAFRVSLRVVIYAVVSLPLVGLAAALIVAGWRATRLVLRRASSPSPFSRNLLVAAALAAPFIPVAISKTRSDVCHIGFLLATTLLVLIALGLRGRAIALHAATALLLASGLTVWLINQRAKYERLPLAAVEARIAKLWGADVLAAMTDPDDKVYVAPLGGVQYLLSRRDNVTAYSMLVSSAYSAAQWPIAAQQIVERKPRVIHTLSPGYYSRLLQHRPEIAQLYSGRENHYFLKGRAGPPLPLPATFGGNDLTIALGDGEASLNGAAAKNVSIDGDRVNLFLGNHIWVLRLSPDGKQLRGERFPDHKKAELTRVN